MEKPLVSIVMVTYKHAPFIEQAIIGVLNQKTDFEIQFIIADDNSPDETASLVNEIIKNHPSGHAIQYLRNKENMGVMNNAFNALSKVQGTYLALCEGDDYWFDTTKLQKQVDFLENNPGFSICFHNTRVENYDNPEDFYLLNEGLNQDTFELKDLIGEDEIWFMATASLVFKTKAILPLPEWLKKSKSGDIPMIMLAARHGQIKYLKEIMAAYRKHPGGASLTDYKDRAVFLENRIFMYSELNRETQFQFDKTFKRNIARYLYLLLNSKDYKDNYSKKLGIGIKYIYYTFPNIPHLKLVLRDHLIPKSLIRLSRSVKKILGLIPN